MVKSINLVIVISLFSFTLLANAAATVKVSVSPKITSGEPINVSFHIEGTDNVNIKKHPDGGTDWRAGNFQQYRSAQMNLGGETKSSISIIFQFYPMRTGNLRLPNVEVEVDGKVFTPPNTIIVAKTPRPGAKPSSPRNTMPMFNLDEDNIFDEQMGDVMAQSNNERKLEVLVVAEPSKTEVYVGELIILPFYVNTNENIFRTLEFAGFPTFKDFLKEELILPKTFAQKRISYRGSNYLRAEVIRFALFPLKPGELLVDPLKMRFEVDTDIFRLRELFQNQASNPTPDQTFLRSSGAIPIVVKPLPPKPVNITQEDIPVGQYEIKLEVPKQTLVQNEPFSLKVHVEGRGNIKGIAEPPIKLPANIQKSKTTPFYSVNTESVGFKDFDLLLVPRISGSISIPENEWTYFDPDKKNYQTLKLAPIELSIEPSSKSSGITQNGPENIILFKGEQDFQNSSDSPLNLILWAIPLGMYACAGFLFVQRRRREEEDELNKFKPWVQIEKRFKMLRDPYSAQGLQFIEEWLLARFKTLSVGEAAFDDLIEKLLKTCHPSLHPKIQKLRDKFRELEALRFGGVRQTTKFTSSFDEIKKISEEIIHSSVSVSSSSLAEEDPDDF